VRRSVIDQQSSINIRYPRYRCAPGRGLRIEQREKLDEVPPLTPDSSPLMKRDFWNFAHET
jgi:hypothetical protein